MKVTDTSFEGGAGLSETGGTLSQAIKGIAQTFAARAAAGVADFAADNSGGTAGAALADVADFTLAAQSGTNAVAKAEAEASFGAVVNALGEIVAKANAIQATVPNVFAALTDSMGGAAADGTIAAIDASATGVDAAMCSASGANTVLSALRSRTVQAAHYVNQLCVATGQTPLTDGIVSAPASAAEWGTVFAAVSTDTGTATDGSDTTAANAIALATEFDVRVGALADAVASMAAKLDAITADANATKACDVVAG
jgi:hypothetical protein